MNSIKKAAQWHKKCAKCGIQSVFHMYYNPLFLQAPSVQEAVFFKTDLGKLYKSIPFGDLASKVLSPRREQSGRGRKPFLKVEGGIGLMILKHYLD